MFQGYKSEQSGAAELGARLAQQAGVVESLEAELAQLKRERLIERQRQQEEVRREGRGGAGRGAGRGETEWGGEVGQGEGGSGGEVRR